MTIDPKEYVFPDLREKDITTIFKAIMQRSKDGLFVTDNAGKVVMINRATEKMCDIKASNVIGRNARELVRLGMWNHCVASRVIEEKKAITMIQTTRRKKKILTTGIPIFNEADELMFVLINDRDITTLSYLFETLEVSEVEKAPVRFELSEYGMAADEMEDIVVRSAAMADVLNSAMRAARFDIPLVFTGESGVGKSMIAKLVHRLSERRNGPFIDLNCGAIAGNLLESELFGHEKGAFTGAASNGKKGLVEGADKGTLFLDEIGELPLDLQVKLLRFLESREMRRVGGVDTIKIDTRIIAATNRDLETMVHEGTFRSDLYFRLNIVPTHIPSLRERRDEIEPLSMFFLERFNKKYKTRKILSEAVRKALNEYHFPGNVRELENLIKRLVTMTEGNLIRPKHLPPTLLKDFAPCSPTGLQGLTQYQRAVVLFEQRLIKEAVAKYGSQRKAAKILGLNQSTLSRKLKVLPCPTIVHPSRQKSLEDIAAGHDAEAH